MAVPSADGDVQAVLDPGAPLAVLTVGGAAEAVTVEVAAELLD